jgi:hypothetical protein
MSFDRWARAGRKARFRTGSTPHLFLSFNYQSGQINESLGAQNLELRDAIALVGSIRGEDWGKG